MRNANAQFQAYVAGGKCNVYASSTRHYLSPFSRHMLQSVSGQLSERPVGLPLHKDWKIRGNDQPHLTMTAYARARSLQPFLDAVICSCMTLQLLFPSGGSETARAMCVCTYQHQACISMQLEVNARWATISCKLILLAEYSYLSKTIMSFAEA
jgi:hypothetical protein